VAYYDFGYVRKKKCLTNKSEKKWKEPNLYYNM
jgi:hypothetical protein